MQEMKTRAGQRQRPKLACALAGVLAAMLASQSSLAAAQKAFTLGGVTVTLEDVTDEVGVFYTSMRLNRALNLWNVEASLTNRSTRTFHNPCVLLVESFSGTTGPLQPDGLDDSGKAFYDLSGSLTDGQIAAGETSLRRTLSLGFRPDGSPQLTVKIFAAGASVAALGLVATRNEAGQPLPGVEAVVRGPAGQSTNQTDAAYGLATVGKGSGENTLVFRSPGYLPVWRTQTLRAGEVAVIPSPRLTRRSPNAVMLTPIAGGQLSNATVQITLPPGGVTASTTATLTPLSGQTLPALLPLGWSPMQAFWLEMGAEPALPPSVQMQPWGPFGTGETGALVRWNPDALQWEVLQLLTSSGNNPIATTLPGSGAFALVVRDTGPLPPPVPQAGQALLPSGDALPHPTNLVAGGSVIPSSSPASRAPELVTGAAEVVVTNLGGNLPSGLLLRCEVSEQYRLRDGTLRVTPPYENFVVAYQRPGDNQLNTLNARFPVRPLLLLGPEELDEALVRVDVLDPGAFSGAVLNPNGGQLASGAVRLLAATGAVADPQAGQLRLLGTTNFTDLAAGGGTLAAAFDLSIGRLAPGAYLTLQMQDLPANGRFVLGRVVSGRGLYGLEPVERLSTDSAGRLATLETNATDRLPGIDGAGQYLLLQVNQPQALVKGIARDSANQPAGGLAVRLAPWLTLSREPDGLFLLLAPTGAVTVAVSDLGTGDAGQTELVVTEPGTVLRPVLSAAFTGPRVVSVAPTNNAAAVARVTPVVVAFNRPINPGSLGAEGVVLLGTNGQPVTASLSLNLSGTTVTLLPLNPLAASTRHTLAVSTNVTDLAGRKLEGANSFTFTTETDALNRGEVGLVIYEPTNGVAPVFGGPGAAEPESPVILVNDTTGETSTILSKVDGSFTNAIAASEEDFISAVLINRNGTRTTLPASRQIFRDGSVGLYRGGGILEAESDAGPLRVTVEPGAIANRTKFKIEQVNVSEILAVLSNIPPTNSTLIGRGIKIRAEGDPVAGDLDVSIPVTAAELAQAGLTNEAEAARSVFGLVSPFTLAGDPVYVLADKLEYENGRLVSHSPPFPGAGRLLNPTSAQREAFDAMLMLNSFGHLGGGAEPAAIQLVVVPLLMAARAQPALLAGKVFEGVADDNNQVVALRTLAGALVTANALGQFSNGRPGRLQPGSICCVSGETGGYALMVPTPELGGVFGSPEEFVLTASHPRRSDIKRVLASAQQANARLTDIIFPAIGRGPNTDPFPPKVSVFHSPDFPAPEAPTDVVVLASHGSGQPSVELVKDDPAIPDDAVEIALDQREVVGPTAVRSTFKVTSHTNAVVRFRASASVSSAPRADVPYAIAFSGGAPAVTNPPPSDLNDTIGPWVIRSVPRNDIGRSAPALATGEPIVIEFNEPISKSVLQNAGVSLQPSAGVLLKELSIDQRLLTIRSYAIQPNQEYTLTINQQVTDIVSPQNKLDQDPLTPARDPFVLRFRTAPVLTGELSGIEQGGGVVLRGNRAFALERQGPLDGAVVVYDLSDPQHPAKIGQLSVPGFPRDVALIPSYAFKTGLNGSPRTNDLLAVVGGKLGSGPDDRGNLLEGFQYIWIIDIEDPASPARVASGILTFSPSAAVTKIQWSPPLLAYLESDADSQAVGLLNLQSFILGSTISRTEFSPTNNLGKDLNGDGDYVDAGEELPIPSVSQDRIAGESGRFGLEDSTQRIQDFDFVTLEGYLGVALGSGKKLDQTGQPVGDLPAGYSTLLKRFVRPNPQQAFLELTGGLPKRLTTLFGLRFVDAAGQPKVADLALLSVGSELQVVEITDPTEPQLLQSIPIPAVHGLVQSVKLRDDGLLLVATTEDLLLLDPGKLALPTPSGNQPHPALRGLIPGAGTGARAFDGQAAGLHVVNLGGRHVVKQTAPQLFFVSFTEPPFTGQSTAPHPDGFRADRVKVESALGKMRPATALPPARFRPQQEQNQTIPSELSPPNLLSHFYVLVQAPGAAGDTIELALESLNESGYPLRNKGAGFAAVRAVSDAALEKIKQRPRLVEPEIRSLTAYRLSSITNDPAFNLYLSRPFALVCEPMKTQEVQALKTELDREILWSGHYLRAYIDYSMSPEGIDNKLVGPFAGLPDEVQPVILPGAVVVAESFPADYFQGPNPVAALGHATAPGTFGCLCLHNGEMRAETIDMNLPSRRMPIIFKRAIAGQDLYEGPFGRGWDFNYNQRIVLLRPSVTPQKCACSNTSIKASALPGDLLFFNGEGRVLVYTNLGPTAPPEFASDPLALELGWTAGKVATFFRSPIGSFEMIVQFTDQRFGRLLPDGTQFWYSPVGRLETIYHRYTKNFQTLHYNDRGELIRIQDRSVDTDRYLDIGYYRDSTEQGTMSPVDKVTQNPAEIGKIYRLVDYTGGAPGTGRDVLFHYTDRGELKQREGIEVLTTSHPSGFRGRQITEYEYGQGPPNAPPRFPLANDFSGVVGGDPSGAPLARVSAYAPGTDTPVVAQVASAQGTVGLQIQYPNTPAALASGAGKVKVTDPDNSSTTEMTLSEFGLPRRSTLAGNNTPPVLYETSYNALGLPEELHYPKGDRMVYTYESVSPNLRNKPNIRRIQRFPSRTGDPLLAADMDYDLKYNFQRGTQTSFDGHAIEFLATPEGLDIGEISYPAVTVVLPPGFTPPVPVGLGAKEKFEYNEFGQQTRAVDVHGVVRAWKYDRPDGFCNQEIQGEAPIQLVTTLTYNGLGGLVGLPHERIPPLNDKTVFRYDEREQLISAQRSNVVSTYAYDANGRVTLRRAEPEAGRPLVEESEYEHTGLLKEKRVLQIETGFAQQPATLSTRYFYDSMQRLRLTVYPNGETNRLDGFDHLGRPHERRLGDYSETYDYDDNNNLLGITIGGRTTEYRYDGHDRVEMELHPVEGGGHDRATYSYFPGGTVREIVVRDPGGQVLYRAQFQIDSLRRTVVTTTLSDAGQSIELEAIDQNARSHRRVTAQGEIMESLYDSAGRLLSDTNSLAKRVYTYDNNNNLETQVSFEGAGGRAYTNDYRPFDSLDRSTRVRDNEGVVSTFLYRPDGKVAASVDARGNTNQFAFTLLGEPASRRLPNGMEFRYAYNRNRHQIFEGDRQNQGWAYDYDSTLRVKQWSLRDGNTFTNLAFSPHNQPQRVAFPGFEQIAEHDPQGRQLSQSSSYLGVVRAATNTYDALDRTVLITFDAGSLSNTFDLLGPLKTTTLRVGPHTFTVLREIRADAMRTNIGYPSMASAAQGVAEERDRAGRLVSLRPSGADPVVSGTSYAAADLVGSQVLGPGVLVCSNTFDGRKRVLTRAYRDSNGRLLAELRYAYDANNNVVARQSVDRAGRADFFHYDPGERLTRADLGVRPLIQGAAPSQAPTLVVPPEALLGVPASGGWSPGLAVRSYTYDTTGLDLLTGSSVDNPNGHLLTPFAAVLTNFDSGLHARTVDGFERSRDSFGNVTRTLLHVRRPGDTAPVPAPATLVYDGEGQLLRVTRDDGVTIDYDYLPNGLCLSRKVAGPPNLCVPSERLFVWDGYRLLEEYDVDPSGKTLRARYYYTDSDVPVAADIVDNARVLRRLYYLIDIQGSVLAVADATANVVERYTYDAWGQPAIEPADVIAPAVRRVVTDTNGDLLIEFSEKVLPEPILQFGTNSVLASAYADYTQGLAVEQGGIAITGSFIFEETAPGLGFGSVVRFRPTAPISGNLVFRSQPGTLIDEWNNPVAALAIPFTFDSRPGALLFTNSIATATQPAGRTVSDQPFMFQGQYFDADAGLVYMRARFYDPYLGAFLQRDPSGYADSVNPYAGLGHNPQSLRDPSGRIVFAPVVAAIGAALGAAIAGGLEYLQQGEFNTKVAAAAAGGALGGATAGFTGLGLIASGAIGGAVAGAATSMINQRNAGAGVIEKPEVAAEALKGAAVGVFFGAGFKVAGSVAKGLVRAAGSMARTSGKMVEGRFAPMAAHYLDDVEGTLMQRLEPLERNHNLIDAPTEIFNWTEIRAARQLRQIDEIQQAADDWAVQHMRKLLRSDDLADYGSIADVKPVTWGPKAQYGSFRRDGSILLNVSHEVADVQYAWAHELTHFKSASLHGGGRTAAFTARLENPLGHFEEELAAHIVGARFAPNNILGQVLAGKASFRGTTGGRGIARFVSEKYNIDPSVFRQRYPGFTW